MALDRSHSNGKDTPDNKIMFDGQKWFTVNYLASNSPRNQTTDAIIGKIQHINVAGTEIKLSKNFKPLGVILDKNLSFATHVQSVSRACHYHIRALKHIRPLLTSDSVVVVACGIINVGSRLDCCNSLLYGTSVDNLSRLQRLQNTLTRVVTKSGWRAHSLPILERLHWLPVEHRIRFKIDTLTFRVLHQINPPYLYDFCRLDIQIHSSKDATFHRQVPIEHQTY